MIKQPKYARCAICKRETKNLELYYGFLICSYCLPDVKKQLEEENKAEEKGFDVFKYVEDLEKKSRLKLEKKGEN